MSRLSPILLSAGAAGVLIGCLDIVRLRIAIPVVASVDPLPGESSVDPSRPIRITFAGPILRSSVLLGTNLRIVADGTSVNGAVHVSANIVSFTAFPSMPYAADHTVEIGEVTDPRSGLVMTSTYSWSFSTRDLAWQPPVVLSQGVADSASPTVSMLSDARVLTVWQQSDGMRQSLWSSRRSTTGWTTPELVEDDNASDVFGPHLASDGNGGAFASWSQAETSTLNSAWANRFDPIEGWGARAPLESSTQSAGSASVAADSIGNAIAAWAQWDGTRFNAWANRFVLGTGWLGAVLIETNDADNALTPSVAMSSSGEAIATWYQSNGSRYDIWANEFTSTWGSAHLIENDDTGGAGGVVSSGRGSSFFAVWCQSNGTRLGIRANRYAGSGWGTAQTIETDDLGDACSVSIGIEPVGGGTFPGYDRSAKIVVLPNGDAVAVWNESDGVRWNIRTNRWSVGIGWGTPALLETDDAGDAQYPEVATDRMGFVTVVWQQSDGTHIDVRTNRYEPGAGWRGVETIDIGDIDAVRPHIAIDWMTGRGAAIWKEVGTPVRAVVSEIR